MYVCVNVSITFNWRQINNEYLHDGWNVFEMAPRSRISGSTEAYFTLLIIYSALYPYILCRCSRIQRASQEIRYLCKSTQPAHTKHVRQTDVISWPGSNTTQHAGSDAHTTWLGSAGGSVSFLHGIWAQCTMKNRLVGLGEVLLGPLWICLHGIFAGPPASRANFAMFVCELECLYES